MVGWKSKRQRKERESVKRSASGKSSETRSPGLLWVYKSGGNCDSAVFCAYRRRFDMLCWSILLYLALHTHRLAE